MRGPLFCKKAVPAPSAKNSYMAGGEAGSAENSYNLIESSRSSVLTCRKAMLRIFLWESLLNSGIVFGEARLARGWPRRNLV